MSIFGLGGREWLGEDAGYRQRDLPFIQEKGARTVVLGLEKPRQLEKIMTS